MKLEKFLTQEEHAVLTRWFDLVVETYPPQTANLLKKESNQFANPVGHTLKQGMQGVYKELLEGLNPEKVSPILDKIIRIRAIQDFTPAQAVSFVFVLKRVIREELNKEIWKELIGSDELTAFESRIDEMALLAFNVYMSCREKLYEVRLNEVKNRTYRLLQRANLLAEAPWHEPGAGDSIT